MARSKFSLALLCVLLTALRPAFAQLGPLSDPAQAPQAKTQQEFDDYLQIVADADPRQVLRQVNAFARAFPDSQLLGIAWQYQMHAFQQLNDFDGLLHAGTRALASNPSNLNTLLTLAPAIANVAMQRPDRQSLLAQARTYATNALAAIDKTRLPREMPLEQWEAEKKKMQAQAHETVGVVALDEADIPTAIHEFETAIALQPAPDGAAYLRLGLAYAEARRVDDAKNTLRRAAELGPDAVRSLALSQIKALAAPDTRAR
jgi:tetratricopeptide (TPR) repeat protein